VQAVLVADPVIHRDEVVALLFNVSEIVVALGDIKELLGDDDGEEEADGG
jgi:ABC-type hemin transport system substrate-binding protein